GLEYYVHDIVVVPRVSGQTFRRILPGKPQVWPTNVSQVGDPDNNSRWHEVDSLFYTDYGALDAALTMLAHNDALLQELVRGLPAAGRTGLALPHGHDHGNDALLTDATYGAHLSYAVGG